MTTIDTYVRRCRICNAVLPVPAKKRGSPRRFCSKASCRVEQKRRNRERSNAVRSSKAAQTAVQSP